jgi:hypothetical protein
MRKSPCLMRMKDEKELSLKSSGHEVGYDSCCSYHPVRYAFILLLEPSWGFFAHGTRNSVSSQVKPWSYCLGVQPGKFACNPWHAQSIWRRCRDWNGTLANNGTMGGATTIKVIEVSRIWKPNHKRESLIEQRPPLLCLPSFALQVLRAKLSMKYVP